MCKGLTSLSQLSALCHLKYRDVTVLVRAFPFHVGSGPKMDLTLAPQVAAKHHFSLCTTLDGRVHIAPLAPLEVDGVEYLPSSPRVLLKTKSIINLQGLSIVVEQASIDLSSQAVTHTLGSVTPALVSRVAV
ncbi:hypothetical protein GMRT_10809 [Giardia muris]|uniref:FHA domain-containing protein n=1 Tax=Giardia muris TaxID=5742 RepID=A0A4Z1SNY6_GIAMU|nr:hypothetical protein GMRT_10809 [Giardia muris]|eukprot:TNJ27506.1 hypothetical protein GMRT_10809 [Giardia muris]